MAFCDYCSCIECRTGISVLPLTHAQTTTKKWICDVCFRYDVCTVNGGHPCENVECEHRPKLITDFVGRNETISLQNKAHR